MALDSLGSLKVRRLGAGKDGLVVILNHGFGAPGDDLVPIGRALEAPPGTCFVFPEAVHSLGDLMKMPFLGDGRAWWPIDMMALERAVQKGQIRDLTGSVPEGLGAARAAMLSLLDALEKEGIPSSRIVLGGFSQGSMLAIDVALRTERPFAGLVVLSGTLLCEDEWIPLMKARKGLPTFMSHGTADPILPFSIAERLRDEMKNAGLDVTFRAFDGGHGIPPSVLRDLSSFLGKIAVSAK